MVNKHRKSLRPLGKTAGEKARETGKKAGKTAAGATKKIGKKLLGYLKKIFIHKPVQYLKIASKKLYIKIAEKAGEKIVELTPEQNVPDKHRDNTSSQSASRPEDLPAPVLAKQAQQNPGLREQVLENPGMIDASSRDEAGTKLELVGGGTPNSTGKQSPDKFFEQLGKEWAALWAYNKYGGQLRNELIKELNQGGTSTATPRRHRSDKPTQPSSSRPRRRSGGGVSTAGRGGFRPRSPCSGSEGQSGSLPGVAKGTVDTDSGETDISTTSNSGSASSSTSLGESSGLGSSGLTGNSSGGDGGN